MPVFFIDPRAIHGDRLTLTGPLVRHLRGSLRVRPGETLWLAEAGGPRYQIDVTAADRDSLTGRILSRTPPPPSGAPRLILGLAIIKGDGMDWAIQKATELGVSRVVPLVTVRTVVRPRAGRQAARWRSIALEAAQQSMRWDVPIVAEPEPFETWCTSSDPACRLLLWEQPQGATLRDHLRGKPRPETVMLAIGPEGGFETREVEQASRHGFAVTSLGSRILRAESAVLAALAIVQYEWGDLG